VDRFLGATVSIHGIIGAVCLISGLFALFAKKQPGRHPLAGRIFSCSLALAFVAVLPNLIVKQNVFLFGIGWLAVYTALEGWRALLRFQNRLDPAPSILDYALNGTSAITSSGLAGFGVWLFAERGNLLGLVCVGFGVLGLVLVRGAWRRWQSPPSPKEWLALHIAMMMGAFSAALTAFLAIQISGKVGNLEWVVWVAPAIVMSILAQRQVRARGLDTEG